MTNDEKWLKMWVVMERYIKNILSTCQTLASLKDWGEKKEKEFEKNSKKIHAQKFMPKNYPKKYKHTSVSVKCLLVKPGWSESWHIAATNKPNTSNGCKNVEISEIYNW